MNHRLQPTQTDEWKSKHKIRTFFENRVLEMQDVSLYFLLLASNLYGFTGKTINKVDKKFAIRVLLAILVAVIIAM